MKTDGDGTVGEPEAGNPPFGALIIVDGDLGTVTHASRNLSAFGWEPRSILGRPLRAFLGDSACTALMPGTAGDDGVVRMQGPSGTFELRARPVRDAWQVEVEHVHDDGLDDLLLYRTCSLVEAIEQVGSEADLYETVAVGLRRGFGFDRVLVYRCAPDGFSDIVAESLEPDAPTLIGRRDATHALGPPLAGRRVACVTDVRASALPLIVTRACVDEDVDLRGTIVEPCAAAQRSYLLAFGATASITIAVGNPVHPLGLFVCQHRSSRPKGARHRAAANLVAASLSRSLQRLTTVAEEGEQARRSRLFADLEKTLVSPASSPSAFRAAADTVRAMVAADGAVITYGGTAISIGATPTAEVRRFLSRRAGAAARSDVVGGESNAPTIVRRRLLLTPLGPDRNNFICWFRVAENDVPVRPSSPADPHPPIALHADAARPWSRLDREAANRFARLAREAIEARPSAAMHGQDDHFQLLAEYSGVVVTLNDMDGVRRYVSPACEDVLGWRPEDLVGQDVLSMVHPDDRPMLREAHAERRQDDQSYSACFRFVRPDGSWLWVEGHTRYRSTAGDPTPRDYVVVLRDATSRKAAELELAESSRRLEQAALIDGLTGIANRRHFDETAAREWRRCEREAFPLSLLLLDADDFKLFNDTYGHQAGDVCLQALAAELDSMAMRPGDLAARYGGEEFLLLLPNTDLDGAAVVAENVRLRVEALAIRHASSSAADVVTVSVGVSSICPAPSIDEAKGMHALLAMADGALYRAKDRGRNRVESAWPVGTSVDPGRDEAMARPRRNEAPR